MTDETPRERQEKARVRRRWLTLGELLAALAVAISALTLWNSYRERANAEARHHEETARSQRRAAVLTLKATPDKDGRTLALAPRAEEQAIQSQTIRFPSALGLPPAETSSDARIERGWIESALVHARKAAGVRDETIGDARVPVLIETRFLADGDPHTDRAVYELGYATSHSLIGGTTVHLKGLSRVGEAPSDAAGRARIDALWKAALSSLSPAGRGSGRGGASVQRAPKPRSSDALTQPSPAGRGL